MLTVQAAGPFSGCPSKGDAMLRDRRRSALDPDPLHPRFCTRRDCDVPDGDTGRSSDQPAERGISLAVGSRSTHPSLDDSLAVVPALNAFDCIAPAARRQTHIDEDRVGRLCPWQPGGAQKTFGRI